MREGRGEEERGRDDEHGVETADVYCVGGFGVVVETGGVVPVSLLTWVPLYLWLCWTQVGGTYQTRKLRTAMSAFQAISIAMLESTKACHA